MILELEHILTGIHKEFAITLDEYRLISSDSPQGFNEGIKLLIDRELLTEDWEDYFYFEREYTNSALC